LQNNPVNLGPNLLVASQTQTSLHNSYLSAHLWHCQIKMFILVLLVFRKPA